MESWRTGTGIYTSIMDAANKFILLFYLWGILYFNFYFIFAMHSFHLNCLPLSSKWKNIKAVSIPSSPHKFKILYWLFIFRIRKSPHCFFNFNLLCCYIVCSKTTASPQNSGIFVPQITGSSIGGGSEQKTTQALRAFALRPFRVKSSHPALHAGWLLT